MFIVLLVYVPLADSVSELTFIIPAPGLNAVVPKSNLLNQLPGEIVNTAVPDPANVRLGALLDKPPEVAPNDKVLFISAVVINPPVPVQVKPWAIDMNRLTAPTVVVANIILFEPNAIARVFEFEEVNVPTVKSNPPKSNVPASKVPIEVAVYVCVPSSVNVTPKPLTPIPPNCFENCGVQVWVRVKLGRSPVNVPPLDSIKVLTLTRVLFEVTVLVP